MSSKKKMVIAISAFAMVILASIIAVVAVFAANTVNIKNTITINYSVEDVVAEVQVYAVKVENGATSINWGTGNKAIFGVDGYDSTNSSGFDKVSDSEAKTTVEKDFTLAKNECVVLKFVFINKSASIGFTATLEDIDTTGKNVNIYHTKTETGLSSIESGSKSAVEVAPGENATATYYVRIAIADTTQNVKDFKPEFNWALSSK